MCGFDETMLSASPSSSAFSSSSTRTRLSSGMSLGELGLFELTGKRSGRRPFY